MFYSIYWFDTILLVCSHIYSVSPVERTHLNHILTSLSFISLMQTYLREVSTLAVPLWCPALWSSPTLSSWHAALSGSAHIPALLVPLIPSAVLSLWVSVWWVTAANDTAEPDCGCQDGLLLSSCFYHVCHPEIKQMGLFSRMMKWRMQAGGGEGKSEWRRLVRSSGWAWNESEESVTWETVWDSRGWRQGCVKHFISLLYSLPVSKTAENLSSIDYWDLMLQNPPNLPLSLSWPGPNLNVQNSGSTVTQSTFPFCWCCNSSVVGLTILMAVPSAQASMDPASGWTWTHRICPHP